MAGKIDTQYFEDSRGAKPRGRGTWVFVPFGKSVTTAINYGLQRTFENVTLTEAARRLPAGRWTVCP